MNAYRKCSFHHNNMNNEDWQRAVARREAMRAWLVDADAHAAMCRALCKEIDVPDWLMARVHARRRWYLVPDVAYWSVEEYIDASRAGLAADVRAYQLEVARLAQRKVCRAALVPTRVPARAGKRARAS
jgi:hypothetical protein